MHLYPPKDNYDRRMQVSLNPPQFFMQVCLFYAEFSTHDSELCRARDSMKKQTVCNEQVCYIFTRSATEKIANTLNKPP